jgi:hypothetical protein
MGPARQLDRPCPHTSPAQRGLRRRSHEEHVGDPHAPASAASSIQTALQESAASTKERTY